MAEGKSGKYLIEIPLSLDNDWDSKIYTLLSQMPKDYAQVLMKTQMLSWLEKSEKSLFIGASTSQNFESIITKIKEEKDIVILQQEVVKNKEAEKPSLSQDPVTIIENRDIFKKENIEEDRAKDTDEDTSFISLDFSDEKELKNELLDKEESNSKKISLSDDFKTSLLAPYLEQVSSG